jgi:hypothetical protein
MVKKALWNVEGSLPFFSEGADGGRVAMSFDTTKLVTIDTVRLRSYLNRPVDFLKMDIEGAEYVVLEDSKDLLCNVKKIFVEYHSFVNKEQNLDKILQIFREVGFRYYIEHIGIRSEHPYVSISEHLGMDLQINIYGYRS